MDITDTLAPKSDQLDAVDLVGGPQTFTIVGVKAGSSAEQPVEVKLAEFPRVWRPGKSMRRVLAGAWTPIASEWIGRRITLFCDPDVKFGGVEVGGIRISHMSHLDGPVKVPQLLTRGKSSIWVVEPLPDVPAQQSLPLRITAAVDRFAGKGIELQRLEQRLGRARADWTTEDVAQLGAAWMSIERGETALEDEFPLDEDPTAAKGFGDPE